MKIAYYHQHFSTPAGAAGTRSYEMARYMVQSGHDVTMICGSFSPGKTGLSGPFVYGKRTGMVEGIRVIEFNLSYSNKDSFLKRTITFLKYSLGGLKLAATLDYDLVFATSTPLTAGIPGIFAKWIRRKPFVFEVRDLWPELPREMGVITNPLTLGVLSVLERQSYLAANGIIGLAPGIVQGIIKVRGEKSNVELVPNGCDLDLFGNASPALRPDGIRDSDLFAVYTGTFGIANNLNAVIDAAIKLKEYNRDDIKIMFIGDGKQKVQLQQRVKDERLDFIFFRDPVEKKALASLLASADIGLQILGNIPAFYYGTSPNKYFDYIASGRPVICNYPGWVADMINEDNLGWAVSPENPDALALALLAAADNRDQLLSMGLRARNLAEKTFDRKYLAAKFLSVIEKTYSDKGASR